LLEFGIEKEAGVIRKVVAQAPAINFQAYSSEIWHSLNTKYAGLRPSQQYGMVSYVTREIETAITVSC